MGSNAEVHLAEGLSRVRCILAAVQPLESLTAVPLCATGCDTVSALGERNVVRTCPKLMQFC